MNPEKRSSLDKENGPENKRNKRTSAGKDEIGKPKGKGSESDSLAEFMLDSADDAAMFQVLKQTEKQLAMNRSTTLVNPVNALNSPLLEQSPKLKQTGLYAPININDVFTDVLNKLDLSVWQRCVVKAIQLKEIPSGIVVIVSNECDGSVKLARAKCHLINPWGETKIEVGDILSLKGVWDEEKMAYVVDKDQGYCVVHPDVLISGTNVVSSLFCRRKAVIHERFRGIEGNNKVMVTGSLVHELLQNVLRKGLRTSEEIEDAAKLIFASPEILDMLYASKFDFPEALATVQSFIPNIIQFIQNYLSGKFKNDLPVNMFRGKIEEITDIEENLWVPQLGLKGKIDVSVRISRRKTQKKSKAENANKDLNNTIVPLELKTGRASFSLEHKGQLILYKMMMTAIGQKTDSGLLLYLRDNEINEVVSNHNEQRDLILVRNELVQHLLNPLRGPQLNETLLVPKVKYKQLGAPFDLPPPIYHKACANCAYATVCCALAIADPSIKLRDAHPLRRVGQIKLKNMETDDLLYFVRWCTMMVLEEKEVRRSNVISSLWTETPVKRQDMGRAVWGLVLGNDPTSVVENKSKFLHTFKLTANTVSDLTLCSFIVGDYVIISTLTRIAIAAGTITMLDAQTLTICLERDLQQKYSEAEYFIMDKHESQSSINLNYVNLALLLECNERAIELRNIIVRKRIPMYSCKLPAIIENGSKHILENLNMVQRQTIMKALTTDSYIIMKGYPGSGKTQALVALIRLLYLTDKTVIVTSHTHSAVDNLLLRLIAHNIPVLRLGPTARINGKLHQWSEESLVKNGLGNDSLEARYNSYQIVGVTCLGTTHPIFQYRTFDYCIVDEATQILQPTLLRPLFHCKKFVLVGDPFQLPPVVRSEEGRLRGATESLLQRLDSVQSTGTLYEQYRMNRTITKLANDLTYEGFLTCGNINVETGVLNIHTSLPGAGPNQKRWLQRVLSTNIDQAVLVLDTLDCSDRSNNFARTCHSTACKIIEQNFSLEAAPASASIPVPAVPGPATASTRVPGPPIAFARNSKRISKYTNYCEAAVVIRIVTSLLVVECDVSRIGIIAPYRAQVELIRKILAQCDKYHNTKSVYTSVEVNTVDQYQGRDKDIIIYSCTKTGDASLSFSDMERSREAEILQDKRRLTVAITRCKHKMIIVGDVHCLKSYSPFYSLFQHIPSMCCVTLKDNSLDFSWQLLFNELNTLINYSER